MTHEVAVRTLCEFTAKRGDLDIRFTPSPSAAEAVAGHRLIATRRGGAFQTELSLSGDFGPLRVRGRADGYDPDANRLEEFKTHRGDFDRIPANHRALHWAQLRIYGWLLCSRKALASVRLALVYLDVASERETVLEEVWPAAELEAHFQARCREFLDWAEAQAVHRRARDEALRCLEFPFADFHAGQKELTRAVYRRLHAGGTLVAQAPTGSGKTVGTLFPALRSMGVDSLDKVFYLVAKTSGRRLALDALRRLRKQGDTFPLRVVELVARGKSCEFPGLPCDGAVCPLARGFYDRLGTARTEAMQTPFLEQEAVRQLAVRHRLCPYYLGQELARWSDVVVGDYNYYFDRSAMLFGWTVAHEWRVAVLVDEAHNLLERGRAMYTAQLDHASLESLRRQVPPALAGSLDAVDRAWRRVLDNESDAHRIHEELPRELLVALEKFVAAVLDHLSRASAATQALQEFFFEALSFCRLAAEFDSSTLFEITRAPHSVLCLRNLIPARFLAPRFAAAQGSILFSATLAPHEFYRDVLGLPKQCEYLDVASPFRAEQLAVRLVRSISTRFRDRQRSLSPLADLIARQFRSRPGNYLAFLSSFEYLERVASLLAVRHPHIPAWKQHAGMTEADREAFLARFRMDGRGIGFAVLGGAFAEGVDLPGSRLIGAFVATLGLPQVNTVNEETRRRMESMFGSGYEYTYLYPGIQKVVQAAGRVIRAPGDRGVLYLIDDRYTQSKVRALLPSWWGVGSGGGMSDRRSWQPPQSEAAAGHLQQVGFHQPGGGVSPHPS